tara:strand:+ start:19387 stop:20121 length:735 start_codon:yes stop_codon:yes gene_type:complete
MVVRRFILLGIVLVAGLVGACSDNETSAPVVNGWQQSPETLSAYIVQPEDTLYAIAWRYGRDYRELAAANNIPPPYHIHQGQRIHTNYAQKSTAKNFQNQRTKSQFSLSKESKQEPYRAKLNWQWPAQGKVVGRYSAQGVANKGIDIANRRGTPIKASSGGEVVYSGHGIRGYGNLIIIKHSPEYLSAYAHNDQNLVKEGQRVKAGQKIASMGSTGSQTVGLHFEIRRAGKPVDPLQYLNKKAA